MIPHRRHDAAFFGKIFKQLVSQFPRFKEREGSSWLFRRPLVTSNLNTPYYCTNNKISLKRAFLH